MTKRQSTQVNAGTVASTTLAFVNPVVANSALFCAIRNGSTTPPASVVDSQGQTFTSDVSQVQTTDSHCISLWSFTNSVGGADSITVTLGSAQTLRVVILEYSGMALGGLFDLASGGQADATTSANTGNISTTQDSELLLCLFGNSSGATILADALFTEQEVVISGANAGRFEVADKQVSSAGIYTATPSQNNVGNLSALIAGYRGFVVVTDQFTGFGTRFLGHFTEI